MVVPLSAIIDQLQGKLTAADLNALLLAVVGQKKKEVKPGDLITADLINQILNNLVDLEMRVAVLENSPGAHSKLLVLDRPINGDQFRIGDEMVLEGENLGFVSGTSVITLAGTILTDYRQGSTDQKIIVKIPGIGSLSATGSALPLNVSNGYSSAQRTVVVRPMQDLTGAVDVSWTSVSPNPIVAGVAGQRAKFDFLLSSRANLDGDFLITPTISRVANISTWQSALKVVDQAESTLKNGKAFLPAGGTVKISVIIDPVPNVSINTPFALSVSAQSGAVLGTTGRLRLSVGNALSLPDSTFSAAIDSVEFSAINSGEFTRGTDTDTIRMKPQTQAMVTLVVKVTQPGNYLGRITPLPSPDAPTTNWTVTPNPGDPSDPSVPNNSLFRVTQAQITAGNGTVSLTPGFLIASQPSSSLAGEAKITIERQGSGLNRGITLTLNVM
jgi:hypothetical protein